MSGYTGGHVKDGSGEHERQMPSENLGKLVPTSTGRQTLRKISRTDQADCDSINVTLFRNANSDVCGWFIGPLGFHDGRFVLPFLPKADETMGSLAVVRAISAADTYGRAVCLIDPDDLWDTIWGG